MYHLIERVSALYGVCCEFCGEGPWSLHANHFDVTQDLPETLESWQCLTCAVLITVMARILIKSLFIYPGALWSPIGALVCSGTAASLVCVARASLTQTAVPSSHSHGRHDEWRRTRRRTHPLREQLSEIEVSHKAGKCQWVISKKVLPGLWFQAQPPTFYEPVLSFPRPRPSSLNWCSQRYSWCLIPPVACGEESRAWDKF